MNADRKRLLLALALACLAAALAWTWLALERRRLLERGETVRVLAARRYLPAYTRLEAAQLSWLSLPRAYAPPGALAEPRAAQGLQTLVPFDAGEPLILNKLALGEQSLAASVPEGRRALSLAVDPVSGLGGLLKPGDRVDVLLLRGRDRSAEAGLLLQGCPVLAVGSNLTRAESSRGAEAATVTLGLSPEDAALALAAAAAGRVQLVLRASGDERPSPPLRAGWAEVQRRLLLAAPARAALAESFPPADKPLPR